MAMNCENIALPGFDHCEAPPPLLKGIAGALCVGFGLDALHQADAALVQLGFPLRRAALEQATRLRYLGVFGTDCSGVDLAAAAERDLVVTRVPGYATESVAEAVFALALPRLRPGGGGPGLTLRSLRVGVVGLGAIGRRTAEIARVGFNAQVSDWSRTRRSDSERSLGLRFCPLDELLATSAPYNAACLHSPSSSTTAMSWREQRWRP